MQKPVDPIAGTASIRGSIVDAHGAPATDATVIVFPEDETRWGAAFGLVRTARPHYEGDYELTNIMPGTYRVVARDLVPDRAWENASYLRALRTEALKIDLRTGETELHLRIE